MLNFRVLMHKYGRCHPQTRTDSDNALLQHGQYLMFNFSSVIGWESIWWDLYKWNKMFCQVCLARNVLEQLSMVFKDFHEIWVSAIGNFICTYRMKQGNSTGTFQKWILVVACKSR